MFKQIRGPLAADISLPVDGNLGTLGNPNRVTKRAKQNDYHFSGAKLEHFGRPLIQGDFVVEKALGSIEGWIQNYVGKLGEELREKNLTELDLGDDLTFTNKTTFDPDTDKWCTIRLMNRGFWKDKGKMVEGDDGVDVEELTNKFESLADFFVNQDAEGGVITSADTEGVAVVSPFPFLHWFIDNLLRRNQFYISDNFLKLHPDFKYLALYHNFNILKDTSILVEQNFPAANYFANYIETAAFNKISSSTWDLESFAIHDLMPDFDVKNLFLSAQNTFNFFFWFNNNRTVQMIDREAVLTGEAFDLSQYRVSEWVPGTRKDVTIKFSWEHDGNDSAFNELWEDLDDKRKRILDPVNTRTDLKSILLPKEEGDIRLVTSENIFYEYGWFPISEITGEDNEVVVKDWKPVSIGLQNYFFNDGDRKQEEIKSNFSTLRMAPDGYPVAYQPGNSKTFSSIREPFSPRLLFYKGNNQGGDQSISGKKFDWKGDAGFVANRYRLTAPFLAGLLPIEADFRVPPRILHYLVNNLYQKMKDIECEFLIDQLDGDPGPEEETLIRIKAYKLEDNFWQFNPGVVPGGGDGTTQQVVPAIVGINQYGKPYLLDETGQFITTSVFGDISTADYAEHSAVDYDAASKQLVVGGNNGTVHIYDLSDGIRMRNVYVETAGTTINNSVSAVRITNGKILVGFAGLVDGQRCFAVFDARDFDLYPTEFDGFIFKGGNGSIVDTIRGFEYYNGYYYMISKVGEIGRCNDTFTTFDEFFDVDVDFTCMAQTSTRMYGFTVEEREWSCLKSNPTNWDDFRMIDDGGSTNPVILKAVTIDDRVFAFTEGLQRSLFVIDAPDTQIRVGAYDVDGVAKVGGNIYVSAAAKLYTFDTDHVDYTGVALPEKMNIFTY